MRRQVVYYSSVAAGGYGDIRIILAEHARKAKTKVSFSDDEGSIPIELASREQYIGRLCLSTTQKVK